MRTAIYARISKDTEGTELGVTRQQEDCRREAERRGWDVVSVFVDNDVSATRSKVRPEYERMLREVRAGHVQAIVVWAVDRLTRTPRELEDVIDLADKHGLVFANVGGTIDLGTPEGRAMARQMGTFARLEVENQAKRLRRKFQEKAEKGEPHGYAPYGFERVDGRNVPIPEQAAVIREAAERTLQRESLRSIVADFNARGLHGPKSERWNTTILRQILLRPTNAGLRQYQGKVIGKSNSDEVILDEGTLDRLTSLLRDPSRRSNHAGSDFKYLLSGVAICGRCGESMRRQMGHRNYGKQQPPSYQCAACFRVRRKQQPVDDLVRAVIIERLSRDDARVLFTPRDDSAARDLEGQIAKIDAKLDVVADQYLDDAITASQMKRLSLKLRADRDYLQSRLEVARPSSLIAELTIGDVASKWDALPITGQREVVQSLITVTIMPSGSGRTFDPNLIRIEWRTNP